MNHPKSMFQLSGVHYTLTLYTLNLLSDAGNVRAEMLWDSVLEDGSLEVGALFI